MTDNENKSLKGRNYFKLSKNFLDKETEIINNTRIIENNIDHNINSDKDHITNNAELDTNHNNNINHEGENDRNEIRLELNSENIKPTPPITILEKLKRWENSKWTLIFSLLIVSLLLTIIMPIILEKDVFQ